MDKRIRIMLDELLMKEGKTQAQLADDIEVRRATINDMYHNRSKQLPIEVLTKIVNYLNLNSIDELIKIIEDTDDNN